MSDKQKVYMIFYRPEGSTTYTPVPDDVLFSLCSWRHANLTGKVGVADDIVKALSSRNDGNEYAIFRCEQTHVVSCGGGRID